MSFVGNFAAARAYKANAKFNKGLFDLQAKLEQAKTEQIEQSIII